MGEMHQGIDHPDRKSIGKISFIWCVRLDRIKIYIKNIPY